MATVNQTRTQRIHRGFNRVGILVGAIVVLFGALIALSIRSEPDKSAEVAFMSVAAAAGAYALSRAMGWIIVGFAGD